MNGHKILPRVAGQGWKCAECGERVIRYRATKLIPKSHWRHATFQQGYIGIRSAARAGQ